MSKELSGRKLLKIDFRKGVGGALKPVVVDVESNQILPGQFDCVVQGGVEGYSKVTVSMWVDGTSVRFGDVGGPMHPVDEMAKMIERSNEVPADDLEV